jgi:hypothetical protein
LYELWLAGFVFPTGALSYIVYTLICRPSRAYIWQFDSKTEDLYNNLIYTTLEEIATLVRTLELLGLTSYLEAESFYEDDRATNDI